MTLLRLAVIAAAGFVLLTFAPTRGDDLPLTRAQDIDQKLKSIFVSIDFNNASIGDAIKALAALSKENDPDHKGINFTIQPDASTSAKPITLKLDNVPVGETLRYMCELGEVQYKVSDKFVTIRPKIWEGQEIDSRTFHVDPSFFETAQQAGVIPAPTTP